MYKILEKVKSFADFLVVLKWYYARYPGILGLWPTNNLHLQLPGDLGGYTQGTLTNKNPHFLLVIAGPWPRNPKSELW